VRCVVGIDLGSTTTKAVLLDEAGAVLGRGITNSRSNYEVASSVAWTEALTSARFDLLERALSAAVGPTVSRAWAAPMRDAFRYEAFVDELRALRETILANLHRSLVHRAERPALERAATAVLDAVERHATGVFLGGSPRKSEFFRDIAGAAYVAEAEALARAGEVAFEALVALYDRAILEVETRMHTPDVGALLRRAVERVLPPGDHEPEPARAALMRAIDRASAQRIDQVAVVGTGYGRQTLPFAKESIRSEILCHGRGAHRVFPGTRTVLDIGGQDTKAIQVDGGGVVTSFQMNDRCAAGCGRYLGYIADELNLGLHELGPLALQATKTVKVCSTCTVFAGAELRERLALGQRREDILAGLHRAIMLRAMSLLARSGGVANELTFTGGVCNNAMAVKVLRELVDENYDPSTVLNVHPDSIYMGALGAALFALDDAGAGRQGALPAFMRQAGPTPVEEMAS
jgi:benzoyl-CoA reductase subunit A